MRTITTAGSRRRRSVDVRARVRGHIQKIRFKDGDMVTKGELLIQLDPRPFQASLDELLAQAKALDAKWDAAQKNVVRTTELIKAKAISQIRLRADRGRRGGL